MNDTVKGLPKLPKHSAKATDMFGTKSKLYTADQMRAYGEKCRRLATEQPTPSAPVVDDAMVERALAAKRACDHRAYAETGRLTCPNPQEWMRAALTAARVGVPVVAEVRMTDCTDDAAVRRAVCAYDAWMAEHHPEKDDAYHDGMREAVKAALYCHQEKL